MTRKRMLFLQELLKFMGLEGRLRLEWISSAEAQKFVTVATEFTEQIRTLGPSPISRGGWNPAAAMILPELRATAGSAGGCACQSSVEVHQ